MAISIKACRRLPSPLRSLAKLQRYTHTLVERERKPQFPIEMSSKSVTKPELFDVTKWNKVDSRTLGLRRSMISSPSLTVLSILQNAGFQAYLVGGCVRDLLLKKKPKDFDVITTAKLREIRRKFHRAQIIGRKFPICRVHVKGSVIEVSSFETVAKGAKQSETVISSRLPEGYDEKDLLRWSNSIHRDFTINSLFYDPFLNKIYDYAKGMVDLRCLKVRTLGRSHLSFKEDCARILRGLRIAARLGLTFAKETSNAICRLSSSVRGLSKSRIMMELNYMLSYGAAKPSLNLLRRFNLLEIFLPFHAASLAECSSKQLHQRSTMLMKLFSNMDKVVTCDQPSDCTLWVGLLAFHMALVRNPQDPLVVRAFSSVLYHGEWQKGISLARDHAQMQVHFDPEISQACGHIPDEELAARVARLASFVKTSVHGLVDADCLSKFMTRFRHSQHSYLVFVPKSTAKNVAHIFDVLVKDIKSYKVVKKSFDIDRVSLGEGNLHEVRFVLGKIIMDTMKGEIVQVQSEVDNMQKSQATQKNSHATFSNMIKQQTAAEVDREHNPSTPNPETTKEKMVKKQKVVQKCNTKEQEILPKKHENADQSIGIEKQQTTAKADRKRSLSTSNLETLKGEKMVKKQKVGQKCDSSEHEMVPKKQENAAMVDRKSIPPTPNSETRKEKKVEKQKVGQKCDISELKMLPKKQENAAMVDRKSTPPTPNSETRKGKKVEKQKVGQKCDISELKMLPKKQENAYQRQTAATVDRKSVQTMPNSETRKGKMVEKQKVGQKCDITKHKILPKKQENTDRSSEYQKQQAAAMVDRKGSTPSMPNSETRTWGKMVKMQKVDQKCNLSERRNAERSIGFQKQESAEVMSKQKDVYAKERVHVTNEPRETGEKSRLSELEGQVNKKPKLAKEISSRPLLSGFFKRK